MICVKWFSPYFMKLIDWASRNRIIWDKIYGANSVVIKWDMCTMHDRDLISYSILPKHDYMPFNYKRYSIAVMAVEIT